MKKMLSCAIVVIMLLSIACSALAIAVQPGETFEVAFSVEANPDNAVAATVKTNYDNTAFTQNNNNSFEGGNGQLFDLNGIKPGTELKSSFTVKDTAPSGDYNLSLSVKQASDINENSVTTLKFNNTTVTVKTRRSLCPPHSLPLLHSLCPPHSLPLLHSLCPPHSLILPRSQYRLESPNLQWNLILPYRPNWSMTLSSRCPWFLRLRLNPIGCTTISVLMALCLAT